MGVGRPPLISVELLLSVEEALYISDSILLEEVKIYELKWGGGPDN